MTELFFVKVNVGKEEPLRLDLPNYGTILVGEVIELIQAKTNSGSDKEIHIAGLKNRKGIFLSPVERFSMLINAGETIFTIPQANSPIKKEKEISNKLSDYDYQDSGVESFLDELLSSTESNSKEISSSESEIQNSSTNESNRKINSGSGSGSEIKSKSKSESESESEIEFILTDNEITEEGENINLEDYENFKKQKIPKIFSNNSNEFNKENQPKKKILKVSLIDLDPPKYNFDEYTSDSSLEQHSGNENSELDLWDYNDSNESSQVSSLNKQLEKSSNFLSDTNNLKKKVTLSIRSENYSGSESIETRNNLTKSKNQNSSFLDISEKNKSNNNGEFENELGSLSSLEEPLNSFESVSEPEIEPKTERKTEPKTERHTKAEPHTKTKPKTKTKTEQKSKEKLQKKNIVKK